MPLSPPLCLQAFFSPGGSSGNDYTTTLNITPQYYMANGTTNSEYNGNNVEVGMYATSNFNGQIFRIKSITSKTSNTVVAVLEDINGTNKTIDTSGGISGGGPISGIGYIFEVNEYGVPALTAINNAPTITFPDSILARFLYDQQNRESNYFIALGQGINSIAKSLDGVNWTGLGTGPFSSAGNCVAWNGTMWVAGGSGTNTIATSIDGITWTPRTNPLNTVVNGIAWGGGLWVAVGNGSTNTVSVATSEDGITWTGRGAPLIQGNGVAWNGSTWVMVGFSSGVTAPFIATSENGINWTTRAISVTSFNQAYTVVWNGRFWFVGGGNTGSTVPASSILQSTNNGVTWSPYVSTASIGATSYSIIRVTGLAWNGTTMMGVGYGNVNGLTGIIIESAPDNLASYTVRDSTIFTTGGRGISWNGDSWVAIGTASSSVQSVANSKNGVNWRPLGNRIFSFGRGVGSKTVLPYLGIDSTNSLSRRLVFTQSGDAAGPVLTSTTDRSAGLFFPSAGTVCVSTDSIERFRMTASGAQIVRVPSTSSISNPGTDVALSVKDNVTYTLSKSVLMEIGSGTREPGNFGNIYKYQVGFQNTTSGSGGAFIVNAIPTASASYNSDGTVQERFRISPEGKTLIDGSRNISNGPTQIVLGPAPSDGNNDYCSMIQSSQDTAVNAASTLSFWTHEAAVNFGAPVERLRIGGGGDTTIFQNSVDGGTNHLGLASRGNRRWAFGLNGASDTGTGTTTAGADLNLYSYADNGSFFGNPMTIVRSNGRVGLGTTVPTQTLDVNGTIRGSGSIVNVVSQSTGLNQLVGIAFTNNVNVIQIAYTPKQTGTVTIVVYGSVEIQMLAGAGVDGYFFQLLKDSTLLATMQQNFNNDAVSGRSTNRIGGYIATTTVTGTSTFFLRITEQADDTTYYKNAYLVLHELSNS